MRVIPFGISSGRPTATRNVSGMAFDLGARWVLVDAGEGTQQQVMRSPLRPSRLDTVLLTHLHGDHVLGLPGLLATVAIDGREAPLRVVGPVGLRRWLEVMLDLPILGLTYELDIVELPDDPEPVLLGGILGLDVTAGRLEHRVPSHGFRFVEPSRPGRIDPDRARELGVTSGPELGLLQRGRPVGSVHPDQVRGPERRGRIVTILGDTAFSERSIELAVDADLLVHECTYAAGEHDRCVRWTHSCTADVARVARGAGVRHVLIDHFSARYADPELLAEELRGHLSDTSIRVTAAVEGESVGIESGS